MKKEKEIEYPILPGVRNASEWIECQVASSCSRTSIVELKEYGIDAVAMINNMLKAEILQTVLKEMIKEYSTVEPIEVDIKDFISSNKFLKDNSILIVGAQVGSIIQDLASFVNAPLNKEVSGGIMYHIGDLFYVSNIGYKIWVDPYMRWDDTRLFVIEDKNKLEYILLQGEMIVAENTMAPRIIKKVLIKKCNPENATVLKLINTEDLL